MTATEYTLNQQSMSVLMCTKRTIKSQASLFYGLPALLCHYFDLFNIAALTVFFISIAIVIGPTPPGTGVIAPATFSALSNSTSPHSFLFSSLFIPTSITTAPSFYHITFNKVRYTDCRYKNICIFCFFSKILLSLNGIL